MGKMVFGTKVELNAAGQVVSPCGRPTLPQRWGLRSSGPSVLSSGIHSTHRIYLTSRCTIFSPHRPGLSQNLGYPALSTCAVVSLLSLRALRGDTHCALRLGRQAHAALLSPSQNACEGSRRTGTGQSAWNHCFLSFTENKGMVPQAWSPHGLFQTKFKGHQIQEPEEVMSRV